MTTRKTLTTPETIQARFGTSWAEIARLTDKHTLAVQSWLSTRAPHVDHFESQGIIANSTGLKVDLFNLALGCYYPTHNSDPMIEAELEALIKFYAEREVPWRWWIGPFTQPPDIFERLKQHGLSELYPSPGLPAMAAPLPAPAQVLNPNVRVWQAADRADLVAANKIRHTAFNFPAGAALTYFEDMAADWLQGNPAQLYLAALDDGPTAAIGALITGADMPGIYVMATLPEWGRRGLGQAIMARMVSEATAAGHKTLFLTAGSMGYGLYQKFGFEHIFNYKMFGRRFPENK